MVTIIQVVLGKWTLSLRFRIGQGVTVVLRAISLGLKQSSTCSRKVTHVHYIHLVSLADLDDSIFSSSHWNVLKQWVFQSAALGFTRVPQVIS